MNNSLLKNGIEAIISPPYWYQFMKFRQNYFTLFILFLLVICRVGAVAHAAEHTFEHDTEYCEICSLTDHNSDALAKATQSVLPNAHAKSFEFYHSPQLYSQLVWDYLSRAPPVFS